MKYEYGELIVEASKVAPDILGLLAAWCGGRVVDRAGVSVPLKTCDGEMFARIGDYIARDHCGFTVYDGDTFEKHFTWRKD